MASPKPLICVLTASKSHSLIISLRPAKPSKRSKIRSDEQSKPTRYSPLGALVPATHPLTVLAGTCAVHDLLERGSTLCLLLQGLRNG